MYKFLTHIFGAALLGFNLAGHALEVKVVDALAESEATEEGGSSEWEWDALIPKGYEFPNPMADLSDEEFSNLMDDSVQAQALLDEIQELQNKAPVVEALNGKHGSISGYAMPLDFEEEQVSEFLLVPYFGACIHVPPPPGNQTIYVKAKYPFKFESMWDPVTISGTLQTIHTDTELAAAGYQMDADEVKPYEIEAAPD